MKFRPCPFCGHSTTHKMIDGDGGHYRCCDNCNAATYGPSQRQANAKWNERTQDAEVAAVVATLRQRAGRASSMCRLEAASEAASLVERTFRRQA